MKAIYERELRSYFQTMIGPVFIAVLLALGGMYFWIINLLQGYPYFAVTLSSLLFLLLVTVPVLTMKSFAEDRHSRAEQLMMSAPVSVWEIVLGKYFAMVTVLAIPCLVFCLFPLIIEAGGTGSIGSDLASILLYFLIGCAFIAIGMFMSSLTESQLIAAVSAFGVLLILYLWDALVQYLPTDAQSCLIGLIVIAGLLCLMYYGMTHNTYISLALFIVLAAVLLVWYRLDSTAFESALANVLGTLNIYAGMEQIANYRLLDLSALVQYLSIAFFGVFLTAQSLNKRRWA